MSTIKDIFSEMKQGVPVQVVVAKVESVDKKSSTCDLVVEGRADRPEARLRAVMDSSATGLIILPKKGSYVLAGLIGNKPESSFVCGYSDIDEVFIDIPSSQMRVDKNGFLIKTGSNSLSGLISDLLDALMKLTVTTGTGPSGTPININDFITLKQKFNQLLKTA